MPRVYRLEEQGLTVRFLAEYLWNLKAAVEDGVG